jgi:hypothetical protein
LLHHEGAGDGALFFFRQASEQCRTASQSRAHFLRQANGRPQVAQGLVGRVDFV